MSLPNLGIDIAKAKFNVCLLQLNSKLNGSFASDLGTALHLYSGGAA